MKPRSQLEKGTIQTARALVQVVDAQLIKSQAAAHTLSTSDSLARHDFAAFYRQASALLQTEDIDNNVVLRDASGQQIVNTILPFGEPLPRSPIPESIDRVFATGQAAVSDVYVAAVGARTMVSVAAPVLDKGRVAYVLSVGIVPRHLNQILLSQHLPPDWVVGIFDSTGTHAARTHAPNSSWARRGRKNFLSTCKLPPKVSLMRKRAKAFHRWSPTAVPRCRTGAWPSAFRARAWKRN